MLSLSTLPSPIVVGRLSGTGPAYYGVVIDYTPKPRRIDTEAWGEAALDPAIADGWDFGEGLLVSDEEFVQLVHACGEPWYAYE